MGGAWAMKSKTTSRRRFVVCTFANASNCKRSRDARDANDALSPRGVKFFAASKNVERPPFLRHGQ